MSKFEKPKRDIQLQLASLKCRGADLGDLGNEIGIAIGKHISKEDDGNDIDSFINGIYHGVSLVDGTH